MVRERADRRKARAEKRAALDRGDADTAPARGSETRQP